MSTLYIIRGLPGSGKTTLAKKIAPYTNYCADDYFVDPETKEYKFNAASLSSAHAACLSSVMDAMKAGEAVIAVHNTFSQPWEVKSYYELCEKYSYTPFIVECQNDFGNIHDVPPQQVEKMRARWLPLN